MLRRHLSKLDITVKDRSLKKATDVQYETFDKSEKPKLQTEYSLDTLQKLNIDNNAYEITCTWLWVCSMMISQMVLAQKNSTSNEDEETWRQENNDGTMLGKDTEHSPSTSREMESGVGKDSQEQSTLPTHPPTWGGFNSLLDSNKQT